LFNLVSKIDIHPVPPKAKGTRGRRETIKPLSGLDVDSLLSREKRQKISEKNAIPEFKQMLKESSDDNVITDASNQMSNIIRSLVKNSGTGAVTHSRAMENMKAFRDEMIALEMPEIYNDFFRDFKNKVMKGQLGGDEREFWRGLRGSKLGLIDKNACDYSEVTETEANEV
jgi:ATP-dependent DNA helicase 2 subunit 2